MQISTEAFRRQVLSCLPADFPEESFTYLSSIDSTNSYLKRLSPTGIPSGTIVCADQQTGGRGRMGRTFLSPPGLGVYLSILLRPDCSAEALLHLTCAAAVAMCNAIEEATGFRPGIKWINDLVYGKKKLCGILSELGLKPDGQVDYAIIGIGVNCCQREIDFPEELRDRAASLEMVTGAPVCRNRLIACMISALREMSGHLLDGRETMLAQYRKDCITLGQTVSVCRGDLIRHGKALDVNQDGALLVSFSPGHVEAVDSGEVSVRGMYGYV